MAAFRGTNTDWGANVDLAGRHGWIAIHRSAEVARKGKELER